MFSLNTTVDLVLASSSPRRSELLSSVGIAFRIVLPDCDEYILPGEDPIHIVQRLSKEKALSVAMSEQSAWIIGADTIVVVDGEVLGKPSSRDDAFTMLNKIQGRSHTVVGGFTIVHRMSDVEHTEAYESQVTMRPLSARQIEDYISTGEPFDKAGAYAIQGVGAALVESQSGSYTNVVGLNLSAVMRALEKLKICGTP